MSELEKLNRRILEANNRITLAKKAMSKANSEIFSAKNDLVEINKQIEEYKISLYKGAPRVSDHAIIRYLERKYGFTFEEVRKEILTEDRVSMIKAGAKSITHDGIRFVIVDNVIVTVT